MPMQIINIREAKAQLLRLVEKVARGEAFVIAKAGKPLVKVTALDMPVAGERHRLGFLAGQISVPADFDRIGGTDLEQQFNGSAS
jgi:prevent-host-death family protein